MPLVLSEEQQMIKDSAAGMLAEKAPVAALRKLRDEGSETGFDPALWQEMVAMGWAGITIDEQYGGLGFGYVGLGQVLEQTGRNLTASPLVSCILTAATALQLAGSDEQKSSYLPAIAQGELLATLAIDESPRHQPAAVATAAAVQGDGYVLNGSKVMVLEAAAAGLFIVSASLGDGISLFLVPADSPGLEVAGNAMVDSRGVGRLTLTDVAVPEAAVLGVPGQGQELLQQVLAVANIGLAAELLGISLEAYERTMAYLKERQQFGVLIGSFQALQHRAAHLFCELELCKSVVLKALQAADAGSDQLAELAAAAKAKLALVSKQVCCEAVQMFGGIGMTDEFEIGFFLKRAQAAAQTWGDANYQLDRLAALRGY
jgi:acyl-CoA dehydrogenase